MLSNLSSSSSSSSPPSSSLFLLGAAGRAVNSKAFFVLVSTCVLFLSSSCCQVESKTEVEALTFDNCTDIHSIAITNQNQYLVSCKHVNGSFDLPRFHVFPHANTGGVEPTPSCATYFIHYLPNQDVSYAMCESLTDNNYVVRYNATKLTDVQISSPNGNRFIPDFVDENVFYVMPNLDVFIAISLSIDYLPYYQVLKYPHQNYSDPIAASLPTPNFSPYTPNFAVSSQGDLILQYTYGLVNISAASNYQKQTNISNQKYCYSSFLAVTSKDDIIFGCDSPRVYWKYTFDQTTGKYNATSLDFNCGRLYLDPYTDNIYGSFCEYYSPNQQTIFYAKSNYQKKFNFGADAGNGGCDTVMPLFFQNNSVYYPCGYGSQYVYKYSNIPTLDQLPSANSSSNWPMSTQIAVGISIAIAGVLIIIVASVLVYKRRHQKVENRDAAVSESGRRGGELPYHGIQETQPSHSQVA